jgi:hypothetical protein
MDTRLLGRFGMPYPVAAETPTFLEAFEVKSPTALLSGGIQIV